MLVNLDITKVIVFNIPQNWVRRSEPDFLIGRVKGGITQSYIYLGVTFIWPQLSVLEAACTQLGSQCVHIQVQPQKKLWLFDRHVMLTLLNDVETWEPKLHRALNWRDLERTLVLIISLMLRIKAFVGYDLIWANINLTPTVTEAPF